MTRAAKMSSSSVRPSSSSKATSSLVDQAAREYERDPDPALPGQTDVDRPAGAVRRLRRLGPPDQRRGHRSRALLAERGAGAAVREHARIA